MCINCNYPSDSRPKTQEVRSCGNFALSARMFAKVPAGGEVVKVTIIYRATCR